MTTLPNDLPPWHTVHQQAQGLVKAGCLEALAYDLRILLRLFAGRNGQPKAVTALAAAHSLGVLHKDIKPT